MLPPSFLLLALAPACNALTLPFNPVQRSGAYLQGLPYADRQRAGLLKSVGTGNTATIPATNLDFVQYTVSVGVGSPPTYYELVVDTGSSNTFVGTGTQYVQTNTSIPTGQSVNVTYGQGFFSGQEFLDQVTLAPGFVIQNQSIGDAQQFADFQGVDGIIGVGPVDLTVGTLSPDINTPIPTVPDTALSQGLISTEVLGVSFAPADSSDSTNGAITLGGTDSSLFIGDITYTPITSTSPSNLYWGVNVTATYGTTNVISDSTAGIVDTGTTQILLADDFFATYQAAIPGSAIDDNTGLLVIPPSQVANILPFNVTIGDTVYPLDANAQLIPQDENVAWGGVQGVQYGYLGPLGSPSGEGLDFILGQKFMERYYAVFDTTNNQVGFAFTTNTF